MTASENPQIKVGDTLYLLHRHRRQSDPKWTAHKIERETAQSWIIGGGRSEEKVNKRTMKTRADFQGRHELYRTQQQMADHDFIDAWRRPVLAAVDACDKPEQLKKIAEILGMEIV